MPISADIPSHSYAEAGVVRAINVQRRRHGLRTLRPRRGLARVSARHTFQMLAHDSLQHASFDGTSLQRRIRRGGNYRRVGEVLAWVPRGMNAGGPSVVRLWMNSPGHRSQILQRKFRYVGVGRRFGKMGSQHGWAFTVDFGG